MQSADRIAIEHFVRCTLGCKCPDEVFESMALERVDGADDQPGYLKLTVGDRLLIYVLRPGTGSASLETVASLMRTGRDERDARDLNRFRLVVASAGASHSRIESAETLESVAGADDRAHLHVVDPAELPSAFRQC
ncbi:MAG TPA: hypothetical protein VKT00_06975 [Casimicrobiaceae bacterium]|nr:hypothetical protein [Casimicrobiaceae bacterium]